MVNIHDLADKKVSLSFNMLIFFLFLLQLSQTDIIKLSHSNCALTKYNSFCSLHNFILQHNMASYIFTGLSFVGGISTSYLQVDCGDRASANSSELGL